MPSSPDDDETAFPSTPTAKRKVSQTNKTPLRNSTSKPKTTATPIRKPSGYAVKTPNTAPARARTGNARKNEPTLLGDFLLGRPSVARQQRRKSLDAVKQELREANLGTLKVPGGVKDRVKQWQKASTAAVVIEDHNTASAKEERAAPKKTKAAERGEDISMDEEEGLRAETRGAKRPGRRKSREEDEASDAQSRSAGTAPKKRVISDEHWMKNRAAKKSSPTNNQRNASQKIPKDFLTKTVVKETLGQRVHDWIEVSEPPPAQKPRREKPIKSESKIPKQELSDDGIRIHPLPDPSETYPKHDGIRIKPIDDSPSQSLADDGIRVKPVRKDGSKRRPKESRDTDGDEVKTPTHRPEKHLRPTTEFTPKSRASSRGSKKLDENDDCISTMTPSPPEKSKSKARKSNTPSELSDIPFGNSAFSVLELPLGAEANTMPSKRPPPKRTPSFGVPKVLKKVYNAVQNTPDPGRGGPNQPASIESWLHGTSDPFFDRPTAPQSVAALSDAIPSRNTSQKETEHTETEFDAESTSDGRRMPRLRKTLEKIETEDLSQNAASPTPLETAAKAQDIPLSKDRPSPISPSGLKRSPATRSTSSPKVAKKSLLKDAIFDAFKGESAVVGKSKEPNPFAEITGLREREINRTPSSSRGQAYEQEDSPMKENPLPSEKSNLEEPAQLRHRPLPLFPRQMGPPPTSGGPRLSTIASVETFSSSSAADTTYSEISQTTVTQNTVFSGTTMSSISRKSNNKPNKPGVKGRLTNHSDLLSVLSLPDSAQPGRSTSIRSARSVRTTRSRLGTATIQDLMREVAEDEAKYMRELKTLVDGVIPVLLTCVLSKSKSAVAAGLFDPHSTSGTDKAFTKPIVDMGVALERLKGLHQRIPMDNADALVSWANQAHKVYHDYLVAWRTGFQDVVVNLAPASQSTSLENDKSASNEMPRNANGDIIGANGERVDVAYLLKRPLVRVKYLNKVINGVCTLAPSTINTKISDEWCELEAFTRKRAREEEARRVDQAANMTDPTRSRDPRTLRLVEDVKIDPTRQVYAKDYFSLDVRHSNGQRIECRVEVFMRDKASDLADSDILICEVNSTRRFLLFPPISRESISARMGDNKNQLVVMIRGVHEASEWAEEWKETFILEAEEDDAAGDWLEMLGTVPVPPQINRMTSGTEPALSELSVSAIGHKDVLQKSVTDEDVPIGERRRREAEEIVAKPNRPRSSRSRAPSTSVPESVLSDHVTNAITDLNDAMNKAGTLSTKRAKAARYHSRTKSSPSTFVPEMSGGLDPYPGESGEINSPERAKDFDVSPESSPLATSLPYIPKLRPHSAPTTPEPARHGTPLKESMRPEPETLKKHQPTTELRDDGAPPPPPHRILTPTGSKNALVLDSPTPKAKVRRSSSPLKHEYQPSIESGTSSPGNSSSSESASDSETDSYSDECSDEDELEAVDMPSALPGVHSCNKRVSPSGSIYSVPSSSLAPSNSASQGAYQPAPQQRSPGFSRRNTASISGWSDKDGKWVDLYPGPCSIKISPGLIQAFKMTAAHSSPIRDYSANTEEGKDDPDPAPLLAQIVTPNVPLRQSNAVDIEIRVHPIASSVLDLKRFHLIRYRAATPQNCGALYQALHLARLQNPQYLKLEEERRINGFGQNYASVHQRPTRRSWIFGRKKSYRASTRAPSELSGSEQSGNTRASAFSVLRGMRGGGEFNIARSTIHSDNPGSVRPSSNYTSAPSDYSGPSPPRTPTSPSLMGSTYSSGILANRGNENMKIRLYEHHGGSKWNDLGPACLTVTIPAAGMRQASSLYHGIERRIIVTRKATSSSFAFNALANITGRVAPNDDSNYIFLDMILGAACFSKIGRTGVCANVWEDITGPNGEVGMVGAVGGVAGRTRKWLFQTGCQADANWVFSLCAVGRNY